MWFKKSSKTCEESNGARKQAQEKRRAPDGKMYTREDFLKSLGALLFFFEKCVRYFGRNQGEMIWKQARRG